MKTAIKYLLLTLFISFIILPLIFLDNSPLITAPNKLKPESLNQAKTLVKSIYKKLSLPSHNHAFSISLPQAEALSSLASQTLKPVSVRVNHLDDLLILYVTIELPIPVSWRYINIKVKTSGDLISSQDSITQIGSLELSNKTILGLAKIPLYLLFSKVQKSAIENSIQSIKYERSLIQVQADPFIDIKYLSSIFKSKAKQAFKLASSDKYKTINPKVEFYYNYLSRIVKYTSPINNAKLSLQSISAPLFKEAEKHSQMDSPATVENKAAIIALALFVGDYNLKSFIKNTLELHLLDTPNSLKFTLQNRRDLTLHFIYSAMIKVIANSDISHSLGEIKEMSDSAKGGSGFSFADLLADRAGTQFAIKAIDSNKTAKPLQKMVGLSLFEHEFFPSIKGLPERLSAQQFTTEFGNKDSKQYQMMIKEIDRRINKLSIYN